MKKVLLLALLLFAPFASAALPWEPHFSWTFPDRYVSGAPLTVDDIAVTSLYCNGVTEPTFVVAAPTADLTAPFKHFPSGDHACYATVTDVAGSESGPSGTVNFTVPVDAVPAPVLSVD